jgi:hypothetical protein
MSLPHNGPYVSDWWVARLALDAERDGDHARAIWIRSQAQEIQACLERGADWPEADAGYEP